MENVIFETFTTNIWNYVHILILLIFSSILILWIIGYSIFIMKQNWVKIIKEEPYFIFLTSMIIWFLIFLIYHNGILNIEKTKNDYNIKNFINTRNDLIYEVNINNIEINKIKLKENILYMDKEKIFYKDKNWIFIFEDLFNNNSFISYNKFFSNDIFKEWGKFNYIKYLIEECLSTNSFIKEIKLNNFYNKEENWYLLNLKQEEFYKKLNELEDLKKSFCEVRYWLKLNGFN